VSRNYNKLFAAVVSLIAASAFSAPQTLPQEPQTIPVAKVKKVQPLSIDGVSEDEWVMQAIWHEEQSDFVQSGKIYSKLYAATQKKEYLFKEVSSSIYGKTDTRKALNRLKEWNKANPNDLAGQRLLLALYLHEKAYGEAEKIGVGLIQKSDNVSDLELAANPYLLQGNYQKGVDLLNKLYKKTKDERVLLRIAAIMTQYMKQRQQAIQLLETHRRIADASPELYKMLIDLYVQDEKLDKILKTYIALYEEEPEAEYAQKIIEIYIYNRDFKGAIAFLEKYPSDDLMLYELYKKEKYFKKASQLVEKFYKKDNDPKWLAEKAILTYEAAIDKNDKKMLQEIVSLFEQAIAEGEDDSNYLNYYGYTLIDKSIDIDKGIKIVQKSLEQQPDNSYYLDSLAWGYFKKGECKKAYKIMKQVVDKEGLSEPEIKEHWDKIRECIKPLNIGQRI
jgi:tetratricopeptide (TPR) repeat protein